jgi:hypothetical protein
MKHIKSFLFFLLMSGFGISILQAQEAIPTSGGNATGTGGSVSYSVGQVVYTTNTGTNGTVAQGVQQPYEISVVTAISNTEGINLECTVYPNPTRGIIKLVVETKDFENLRFQLFDLNGILLQDKKVEAEETEILMDSLSPSTYFLKILNGNKEIKTFKIIKN